MNAHKRKLFGTDGIRGVANKFPMTVDLVTKFAMATALEFRRGNYRHSVVIGKDTRLSGYMLEPALTAGFIAMGLNVYMVGPMPTPAVAMLTRSLKADFGVMISASHNPFCDNGLKLFGPDGYKLSDEMEIKIEKMIDQDLAPHYVDSEHLGRAERLEDAPGRYIEFAKRSFPKDVRLDGLKIVIDCANGAAYKVAPKILWELGAEIVPISITPNGKNINDKCGATHPSLLAETVLSSGADIGIALDGDADRLIVCDEKGKIVDGDQIMALISKSWLDSGRLKGNGLVATIMSNLGLERFMQGHKMELRRTAVGDRYVIEEMRKTGFNLGGEQSGHIIMADSSTTGDGIMAALQVLAAVQIAGKPVSEVCALFDPVPQLLKNVHLGKLPASIDILKVDSVMKLLKEGEEQLGSKGRLVVRKSGTEPLIRLMAECEDEGLMMRVLTSLTTSIEQEVRNHI